MNRASKHFTKRWGIAIGLLGFAFSTALGGALRLNPVLLFCQMVAAFIVFLVLGLFLARFTFSHRIGELAQLAPERDPFIDIVLEEELPSQPELFNPPSEKDTRSR